MPPKFKNICPSKISYPNGASGAPCPPRMTSSYLKLPMTSIPVMAAMVFKLAA